jgi:hypothetical protein
VKARERAGEGKREEEQGKAARRSMEATEAAVVVLSRNATINMRR